jgi:DNA-binding IclR family transcriptional regulator
VATRVPAVDRAAEILEFLSRDPTRGFTASEIATAVGIHKATCYSTVMCLDDLGFVRRDDDRKLYYLGPTLVGLGFAAARRHRAYVDARAEMFRLAAQLDVSCLISVRDGDEIVVVDIAGDTHPAHLPMRIGRRVPLTAALGSVYYAWAPLDVIERWIGESEGQFDLAPAQRRHALAVVRGRGYSLGGERDFGLRLDSVLRKFAEDGPNDRTLEIAMEVADLIRSRTAFDPPGDAGDTRVNFIIAPIFDATGQVGMAFTLFGRPGQLTVDSVPDYAEVLLAAASRVTAASGGRMPEPLGGAADLYGLRQTGRARD